MVYSNRKVEDQLLGYEIQEQGDYEICFNNRYSMLEHKRIFWQFEIEGAFDVAKAEEKLLNATVEFYNEASNQVQKVVRKVCSTFDLAHNKLDKGQLHSFKTTFCRVQFFQKMNENKSTLRFVFWNSEYQ